MSIEEAEAKARELNVMFIETSAKAGFNIKVFLWLGIGVVSSRITAINAWFPATDQNTEVCS